MIIILFYIDKGGVPHTDVNSLFNHICENCSNLEAVGLMTIGAYNYDLSLGPNPDFLVIRLNYYAKIIFNNH